MTQSQRRYVKGETAISVAINTLISVAFVYLVFGGAARIAISALIADSIPQSSMIALMGTIVPTLLTRKRLRTGAVSGIEGHVPKLLKSLAVRAMLVAFAASATGFVTHAALLSSLAPDGLSFVEAMAFKSVYGALLAAIVTPAMLQLALAERFA